MKRIAFFLLLPRLPDVTAGWFESVAIAICHLFMSILEVRAKDMKNFHLPLPERTYAQLRAEAARTQVPATTLAREAIDLWLRNQFRAARHEAIAGYAEEMASTNLD